MHCVVLVYELVYFFLEESFVHFPVYFVVFSDLFVLLEVTVLLLFFLLRNEGFNGSNDVVKYFILDEFALLVPYYHSLAILTGDFGDDLVPHQS